VAKDISTTVYKTHDFRIADLKVRVTPKELFCEKPHHPFFTPCFSLVVCKLQFFLALAINLLFLNLMAKAQSSSIYATTRLKSGVILKSAP